MEIYVPGDRKYWVDGREMAAYTDGEGVVVDDWSGPSFVDGSAWIDVTMHLLDQSDQLEADELCRVRDALRSELPYGNPDEQPHPGQDDLDEESLFHDTDASGEDFDPNGVYDSFDSMMDDLFPDDIDGTSIDLDEDDSSDEDSDDGTAAQG